MKSFLINQKKKELKKQKKLTFSALIVNLFSVCVLYFNKMFYFDCLFVPLYALGSSCRPSG